MSEIPDLDPDAAVTPQRTAALAETAARAIRALSIATRGGETATPCIGWPISPQEVPASLAAAALDIAQVCRQFADQLQAHRDTGTFEPDIGAAGQIAIGVENLDDAAELAEQLRHLLERAQAAISCVHPRDPDPEQDDDLTDQAEPASADGAR